MKNKKFFLTFGQTHIHKVNGKIFDKDCICVIEARNSNEAREKALEHFGTVWAFLYYSLEDAQPEFYPRGLINLED